MNLMLDYTIPELLEMAARAEATAAHMDAMRQPVLAERARENADLFAAAANVRAAFIARQSAA